MRESIKVLHECISVQEKKSVDYQNENSTVVQADYYPNGIATIHDILHAKMLRARSLIESGATPQNEALEDTFKDLINYASFAVAWLRERIPGQDPYRDHLNRPKLKPGEFRTREEAQAQVAQALAEGISAGRAIQEDLPPLERDIVAEQKAKSWPNKVPSTSTQGVYER